MAIKILRPSLDDLDENKTTILRGVLSNDSLDDLRCDFYQREKLPESSRRDIMLGYDTGTQLPDVELAMRGDHFDVEGDDNNLQAVKLLDPVFIVDGRQRIETLKDHLKSNPTSRARLGAIVHFNTTPNWERSRFHILNSSRVKVSPNLLLRNIKDDYPGIATIYGLTTSQPKFPLYRRVTWKQTAGQSDLISAHGLSRVTLRLHSHLVAGKQSMSAMGMATMFQRLVDRIGLPLLRQNMTTFWEFMDETWSVSKISGRNSASTVLRTGFLVVLSDILCQHVEFWAQPDEFRLQIPYTLKTKFAKFAVHDPEVVRLSGAAGKAQEALYFIIISHLNSGKRTKRLVPRNVRAIVPPRFEHDDDEDHDEDDENERIDEL